MQRIYYKEVSTKSIIELDRNQHPTGVLLNPFVRCSVCFGLVENRSEVKREHANYHAKIDGEITDAKNVAHRAEGNSRAGRQGRR